MSQRISSWPPTLGKEGAGIRALFRFGPLVGVSLLCDTTFIYSELPRPRLFVEGARCKTRPFRTPPLASGTKVTTA